jgi:serine/threonine-protein kinase
MIGKILGNRYEVTEKLGVGGMAEVFKAHDSLLQRSVTVKVLRSEFSADEEFVARFHREARAVASLAHPNIVNVYDVGREGDVHYLVMEFVDGEDLKSVLKREGSLTPSRVVTIARQICDALEHAHHHKIIHRDVKPHNILITNNGQAKLADFGIARESTAATLVQTKSLVGSVHYISPEQARGDTADAQSDIYALGVVLYEMLTGTVPFSGGNPVSVALKHIQDEIPSLQDRNPDVTSEFDQIVRRAMSKIPADRFASAREMAVELNSIRLGDDDAEAAGSETMVYEPVRSVGKRLGSGTLIGIILAVVGLAIGGFWGLQSYVKVPEVVVPSVEELLLADAQRELERVGLRVSVSEEYSSKEPGVVIKQDVTAGSRIKQQRVIFLTVSRGPELVRVPDVIGRTLAEARSNLRAGGFEIGEEKEIADELSPPGTVVRTEPSPNSIHPKGDKVRIYISKPPEPILVTVPNLIGLEESAARARIAAAGLLTAPDVGKRISHDYPAGQVIAQDPRGGVGVEEHAAVGLTVSEGPGPEAQSAVVYNTMPHDGWTHTLRIMIRDAHGEREAYTGEHESGERVSRSVRYYGRATIGSYIDGNLVNEQTFE